MHTLGLVRYLVILQVYIRHILIYSFIHSFWPFNSAPSSPLPLRGAPDYSTGTVSEFHAEAQGNCR